MQLMGDNRLTWASHSSQGIRKLDALGVWDPLAEGEGPDENDEKPARDPGARPAHKQETQRNNHSEKSPKAYTQ